ncbi:PREDICTED: RNA-binding protein 33-like [Amphimedon queenslandica]|uniref:Uncharacterized protein n=1 Tax=Amphimedon queenslandica TaxID=400682 RepID=A0AAN0K553_AMPQE|nr:PREDICTED: RNA-binding protein 33-like [Amphimedon queenslandica]XP_019864350.1 PREDICTED: RNA-binding protein 33-like [Amphimedon queenslandica]|eukprot:XP_019864349.1 PREDICTED: RNA-binding protein 33-like [Amphimedon queenslandica]
MSSLPSSSPDVAVILNTMNRQLSVKDKESLVYLAEILTNEAKDDKSLLTLLADLRHKYCYEKKDANDILRILLELAELKRYADSLRDPNQFRPPKLEDYRYIPDEKCKLVGMRSCLVKLVSSLTKPLLRTLLEMLCHEIDSNPENYTSIYILFRELEQKAIISPGRLKFIYKILENDAQFANVRYILVEYQEQFYNDGQRRSSTGNNPVHVDTCMSCPPSNQVPNQPLYPAGSHSLRGSFNPPPPFAQQRPIVPRGVHPPHHQIGRGGLYQRQISAPPYNFHNSPHSQSNRLHQSDSFQRPMDWSPNLQRNQPVRPFPQNHPSHFDPQPTQYPQQPNQYSDPPAPHQSNQYYREQSGQSYRPPNQQLDQNYHPPPPQPHDQSHSSFHPSFSSSSQAPQYDQYYTRPVLPQDQRSPPPPLPPSQQTGESLSTRWQQGTMVGISSQQHQQQVIDQSINVPPPLPSPFLSGQMPQVDSYGPGGQLEYPTNSWPNEPAGPTVQIYSSSVAGAFDKPAIRSRQNSEPAGNSPSKRNPPPKKSNTLPEDFSLNSRTASNPQTSSSIHQHHVHISQSNSNPPAPPAGSLVILRHQNFSPNSPGHSINVSVSRRTPSPAAQAASCHSNVSTAPYDVEAFQVQEMRMKNEEEHM